METKAWYLSRTLWFNLIAGIALIVQSQFGFLIDVDAQAGLLTVINLALRVITSQPLEWKTESPAGNTAGRSRLSLLVFLAFAALWLITACATTAPVTAPGATTPAVTSKDNPMQLAGKSLLAVKSTIVTAASAVDALCKAGKIAPDKCTQAKAAYDQAKPAYDSAVDAYLLMSQGYGDPAAFGVALARVQTIANNMLQLAGGAQ
jgi:hypothetical protein